MAKRKAKAAVLYELNKPLVIRDVEIPELKPGQVLVKILYSGICRAQLNEITGLKGPDRFLPHMLGHEGSAIVEDTGADVKKVRKGDYVVLSWIKGAGLDVPSTQYRSGDDIINAGAVTTYSDYSVVSENRVTPVSQDVPPEIAAVIGCAVGTGAGIVRNTLKARAGTSIAVFGTGGIGLSIILAAKESGCSPIVAIDISEEKLALAKRLGSTHEFLAQGDDLEKRIRAIVPNGVDYAVDASGAKASMETGFDVINYRGICVIAGNLRAGEKISIYPFELIKGKRIVGTWGGETDPDADFPHYARQYLRGELAIDKLITHQFSLEEINEAFEVLKSGCAGRIVLQIAYGNGQESDSRSVKNNAAVATEQAQ